MYFNKIDSDGKNKEGIGSICQFQLLGYGLSKSLGQVYHFNKFKNVAVGKNENNLDDELNNFFNFDYDLDETRKYFKIFEGYFGDRQSFLIKIQRKLFYILCNLFIKKIQKNKYLINLSKNLKYGGEKLFDENKINVAIHLRSPQYIQDVIFEEKRRVYYDLFSQVDYINTIIRTLEHENSSIINFFIFTDTNHANLELMYPLKKTNKISYVITDDISKTIYHLVKADILIAANSGFSLISHYLSDGKTYFHKSILQRNEPIYINSVLLNDNGYVIS